MLLRKNTALHPRRAPTVERPQSFSAMMKCVLFALPVTVLLGALLLLGLTALLLRTADPARYHTAVGLAALYLIAAMGGHLATRLYERRAPLLCGFFEGVCLVLVLSLPALFLPSSFENGALTLLLRLLILPACICGAWLCARKRKTRRHRVTRR